MTNKVIMKEGDFKIGYESESGILVVGFYESILDLKSLKVVKYSGADVNTQWQGHIQNSTGRLVAVILEIVWDKFGECLKIPFPMSDENSKEYIKVITDKKILLLTNIDVDGVEKEFLNMNRLDVLSMFAEGISVDVNSNDVLEWFELEEAGGLTRDWKPKGMQ